MVDWSIARQVARLAAGTEPPPGKAGAADFAGLSANAERLVADYTGLTLVEPVPAAEPVRRREWAEINIHTLQGFLDPVAERMSARLERTGPFAGALRAAAGATLAAEVGLIAGYMSQRVLGQYEVSLLQPDTPARLLYVAPNLGHAIGELDVDADAFLAWIALHEMTHVFEFSGVPWLRSYMADLLREYLHSVEVRIDSGGAGALPRLPAIAELVDQFREGGLVALVQTSEQRDLMRRLQAAMSVVEGYSEHVMDAVGGEHLENYAGLREAMERRRANRSAPQRLLEKLLGLDLKMRQYDQGKRFCDGVAARGGIELLNRVWEAPASLPRLGELNDPGAWVDRIQGSRAAA
jgi:coenzyme F420 biosynthesis associated uncharacterized protein